MITTTTTIIPQAEAQDYSDCSPPVDYDENTLIERCNEGHYLIDKETGEKNWVGTVGGMGKACDEVETEGPNLDMCIVTP